ncbi:hypothetical protein F0562_025829 [Nyssa sinensis]|uniref:RWP-RK domain-containing protein n=1 Tax=Nyssa sinensis TaxID=561372 RepID=A0A5J5BBK3_9ASTE|nr:hypothetical protein F0562_025829 [Nyssa sinensis]
MEEEPCSDDKYQDYLLSTFKEKLSCHRPTSSVEPWIFWSPTDHLSCLPPPDSVGIKDKIKSVLLKLSFEAFHPPILFQFWAAIMKAGFTLRLHSNLLSFLRAFMCCAGVLELVSPFFAFHEVDAVCKALEAVDLKCLGQPCNHFDEEICNKGLQHALDEIYEVLEVVCKTPKLPLAQTWVPCKQCNSEAISSFRNKSPRVTLSNISDARYHKNFELSDILEFSIIQSLQLQEDQGVVGRAYLCCNSSFCRDITQFSVTEYPMVYWARYCKLFGCFAICLKSSHTGVDDYILEFFLPPDEINYEHPRPQILDKILETMKQHFRSFKVASGEPLGVELFVEVINNGRDIGSTIYSREKGTMKTSKRKQEITREVLEQNLGRNFGDVAKSFNGSESTLKRFSREHGIPNWPHLKIDKVNYSLSNMDPACSDMPRGQAMATAAHIMPHVTTM